MDSQEELRRKLVPVEEALKVVKSGDRVVIATPEPQGLGLALAARKDELRGVRIFNPGPGRDVGYYDPGWEDSFEVSVGYILPMVRQMMLERRCDYVVGTMFWTQQFWEEDVIDVLLIELSHPDEHGFCSFGSSIWHKKDMVEKAKVVIAEANPNLIRTYGDNFIHMSNINIFVEHISSGDSPGTRDLLARKTSGPGVVEKTIADYISTLIKDGDTIQIGVGTATEYITQLGVLDKKKDLGFHSEAMPRGTVTLVKNGIITGKLKTIHTGKIVVTMGGGGTKEEMDFVNKNPMFELHRGRYVTDPRVISSHDNMVAINGAIAIDLTGQIAAESIGTSMVSGTGGQLAFAIGANLSRGGRNITALPSTAKGGKVSRIVPIFEQGTVVTVPRNLADIIVTEYGIAKLRGKTQRERAQELIAISHPDFRNDLSRDARRLFWP